MIKIQTLITYEKNSNSCGAGTLSLHYLLQRYGFLFYLATYLSNIFPSSGKSACVLDDVIIDRRLVWQCIFSFQVLSCTIGKRFEKGNHLFFNSFVTISLSLFSMRARKSGSPTSTTLPSLFRRKVWHMLSLGMCGFSFSSSPFLSTYIG